MMGSGSVCVSLCVRERKRRGVSRREALGDVMKV